MTNKQELILEVNTILDGLRPYLKQDGGDIEVVDITDEFVVQVRLKGNCETCPMSFMTMKAGVEASIKKSFPQITKVEAINI